MKQNLYYPFEIIYKEAEHYDELSQGQNFFELVYILEGSGKQYINGNSFDYKDGHLFLVTPKDLNTFDIQTRTKFLFICFNEIYLKSDLLKNGSKEQSVWLQKLEFILHNATHAPGCILKTNQDKELVKSVVTSMVNEQHKSDLYSKELIQQLMNSLIVLVARSIAKILPENLSDTTDEKVQGIFQYIQLNIYEPDKLRTSVICSHFNVSPNYLGKFFKHHAEDTLQQFIIKCKLKIIETRLLHSNSRISEIVDELRFTDISHLNRFFKKHKGISPSLFRKKNFSELNEETMLLRI
ncbi:AraC family transcriptional regulator [Dyadobacter tibetensis]|uniref:AraC family transcriptional regulator n=1 Tax=Dyadobacter tibetensis TaxID=1211851 RepID=UPI0004711374|nr:AraC family transcriptional regulator [Dyadobacter tibetensis]